MDIKRTVNIIAGFFLGWLVAALLAGLSNIAHIDLAYNELDKRGQIAQILWVVFSFAVGLALFVWVIKKNPPSKR